MKNIHYKLLKKYLDELIINQGIIKVDNPEKVVDKIKVDFLIKLAFRFYSKLYSNEVRRIYKNRWEVFRCENCLTPCKVQKYFYNEKFPENEDLTCPLGKDLTAEIQCINCGVIFLSKKPENNEYYMPICNTCHNAIGEELEIWQRLFE